MKANTAFIALWIRCALAILVVHTTTHGAYRPSPQTITIELIGDHDSDEPGGCWYDPKDNPILVCQLSCKKPGSTCSYNDTVTNSVQASLEIGIKSGIDFAAVKKEFNSKFTVGIGSSQSESIITTIAPFDCYTGTVKAYPAYHCKRYKVTQTSWWPWSTPKTDILHVLTPIGGVCKVYGPLKYEPTCPDCPPQEPDSPPSINGSWHCMADDIEVPVIANHCDSNCGPPETAICGTGLDGIGPGWNDVPLHNGGDSLFLYSSPSSGFSSAAYPPDVTGDLFWRAHSGADMMNDVYGLLGAAMEIDGYYEPLYDTDWSTPPAWYIRSHGPALPDGAGLGGLEPAFFQLGLTAEIIVAPGGSGFGNPCTVAPSLCSPSGGSCPPAGYINGYDTELSFGSTPGSGVFLPADGTTASDLASTWFVHGGMTASGGACGLGDYQVQDLHSVDESRGDATGNAINPDGGFQLAGGGAVQEALGSMATTTETWRGNVVQFVADTGTGLGVEAGTNGGGASNGRDLSVGSGLASLGIELRDLAGSASPNVAIAGVSFTPIPNPGLPALGGNLLVLPDGLFNASSSVWQGGVAPTTFNFTTEGAFISPLISIPSTSAGATLYGQGATFSLVTFTADTTNSPSITLLP